MTILFVLIVCGFAISALWRSLRRAKRADHIRSFVLPKGLFDKLRQQRPALSAKDCQLVAQALRQFFLAYQQSGQQPVAMPSQVVDELWHEFILYTRDYQAFCKRAFGQFLHHTPAVALGSVPRSNAGLRRCWWFCCRAENINPRSPTRLPLLFAIDNKLRIEGGFSYVPDCGPLRQPAGAAGVAAAVTAVGGTVIHCAGDFSDASVDGSLDGLGQTQAGRRGGGSRGDRGGGGDPDGGDGGGGDGGGCGGGGE
jgi:hypothetical protein